MTNFTALFTGKIYETTAFSRREIQDYRTGIPVSSSGISSLMFTLGPGQTAGVSAFSTFFQLYCTGNLKITLISPDPVTQSLQTINLVVSRLFTMTAPGTSVSIVNNSTTNITECRVIYN